MVRPPPASNFVKTKSTFLRRRVFPSDSNLSEADKNDEQQQTLGLGQRHDTRHNRRLEEMKRRFDLIGQEAMDAIIWKE